MTRPGPWWRPTTRTHWRIWFLAMLGWSFDGYEATALTVVLASAMGTLLPAAERRATPVYASMVVAAALLGWGLGGCVGGVVSDYLGRKRAMIYSILVYAVFTGLTGLATTWQAMALFRFLTGFGIGTEWGAGTALVAETWPDRARTMGMVLLQSGFGVGAVLAALVSFVALHSPGGWRWVFFVGVLPALVTLALRSGMPESERWQRADARRRQVRAARREGRLAQQTDEDAFTLSAIFHGRQGTRTLLTLAVGVATAVAYWGASTWMPLFMVQRAVAEKLPGAPLWGAYTGIIFNVAAIVGYIVFGPLAESRLGRRGTTALYMVIGFVSIPVFFYLGSGGGLPLMAACAALAGFSVLGQFSWMTIYLPELFPTRARVTGAGFIFNFTRFFVVVSLLAAGALIVHLGGVPRAATIIGLIYVVGLIALPFLPETRGQPLPD